MQTLFRRLSGHFHAFENGLSVRTQITVAAAAIALVLTGALATGAAFISYHNTAKLMNATLANAASSTAERLDQQIGARKQSIESFSQMEPLRRVLQDDPAILRTTLDGLQRSFTDFAWIGFARTDGVIVAATGGMLQGVSVAGQDWFKAGLQQTTVGNVHEAEGLSVLLGKRNDGEPHRFIDIAVPVRAADHQVIGVIGAHLSWDWAQQIIASAEDTDGDGERDTKVSVTTGDGTVLLGRDDGAIQYDGARLAQILQSRLVAISPTIDANTMLAAFKVSKHANHHGANWTVTASQPSGMALAAAIASARTILLIGAVCSLAGIAFAFLTARRISRPIIAITREADRIGRASGPVMLHRQSGSSEVMQLTRALRSLLRRIGFAEERIREAELRAVANTSQLRDDLIRMQRLASTDHLTDLLNRRAFLEAADTAMELSQRGKRDIATLMIDIDHFKRINDEHGHAAGDATIRRVAEIVRGSIGSADRAARFGGEEFVVLLRGVNEATAQAVAERLRHAIERASIRHGDMTTKVTVSIGIAVIATQDRDVQDMIERADQGLYLAKNAGRNRAVLVQDANGDAAN